MNIYIVNFVCRDNDGHNFVRSEEIVGNRVDEVVDRVKGKWGSWDVEIIWAGIRLTDGAIE